MQPAAPSTLEMILPFGVMFVIFYFLIIRPQGKKLKDHEKYVNALKRGDAIVTTGGLLGTVDGLNENIITLEIADGVKVKILKKQIAGAQAALLTTNTKS